MIRRSDNRNHLSGHIWHDLLTGQLYAKGRGHGATPPHFLATGTAGDPSFPSPQNTRHIDVVKFSHSFHANTWLETICWSKTVGCVDSTAKIEVVVDV
ncbi:hypothetical protein J6590_026734 [Homalodisca vitripennis]|nr:hypothetical protein J6590_026734 [Homalodisca vitripennis]